MSRRLPLEQLLLIGEEVQLDRAGPSSGSEGQRPFAFHVNEEGLCLGEAVIRRR